MRGEHKEVDRGSRKNGAEGDYDIFFYKFSDFTAHFLHLFFLIIY